jgi:hypothetical protein
MANMRGAASGATTARAAKGKSMDAVATDIHVHREVRDGWFVYTCATLPGLIVASKDDQAAYDDVPRAITLLYRLDMGLNVSVAHKLGYDEFTLLEDSQDWMT